MNRLIQLNKAAAGPMKATKNSSRRAAPLQSTLRVTLILLSVALLALAAVGVWVGSQLFIHTHRPRTFSPPDPPVSSVVLVLSFIFIH